MGRDMAFDCQCARCDHCDDEWGPFQVCFIPQPTFGVRTIVNDFYPPPPLTAASTMRTMHTWVHWSWCHFSNEWLLKQVFRHVLVTVLTVDQRTAHVDGA